MAGMIVENKHLKILASKRIDVAMVEEDNKKPSDAEKEFLNLAYNRFYDIFDEIIDDAFWEKDDRYRFSKIKDIFCVYSELLNYEPIKWIIEHLKTIRPPMEAEIGGELFKFVRNVISHFPFFDRWEDVWINKNITNWDKEGQSVDKFLLKYEGHSQVKYRFWEENKRKMTYLSINFPNKYLGREKIFLKDMLSEKGGIKFSIMLMRKILNTQVEEIGENTSSG